MYFCNNKERSFPETAIPLGLPNEDLLAKEVETKFLNVTWMKLRFQSGIALHRCNLNCSFMKNNFMTP
jgi:hypothetical protein